MERHSLYIDHQRVSGMIQQLQSIVKNCHQELDCEYATYELRTSVYEQFIYEITDLYEARELKIQNGQIKVKDEEGSQDMRNLYELSAKLQDIQQASTYDAFPSHLTRSKPKGRPNQDQEAEDKLIQWVKEQTQMEGKLKFSKKQLDERFQSFLGKDDKKVISVNKYLKMLSQNDLSTVTILTRKGEKRVIDAMGNRMKTKKQTTYSEIIKVQYEGQSQVESIRKQRQTDFVPEIESAGENLHLASNDERLLNNGFEDREVEQNRWGNLLQMSGDDLFGKNVNKSDIFEEEEDDDQCNN